MKDEKESFSDSKEYHIAVDFIEEDKGVIVWKLEIDLPGKRKQIKVSSSALTVDKARKDASEAVKFFLMQEI